MSNYNPKNERIKYKYRQFLIEAKRQSEATVDQVDRALVQFEASTGFKDFKRFHIEQANAFKRHLTSEISQKTGKPMSKASINRTLKSLKAFFQWLSREPGFKSSINYSDAEYFNLSAKDVRIASARRPVVHPTLEQINRVVELMPAETAIQRRDRALIALTILTGARNSALATFKLMHIDLEAGCVHQDAREVKTKFSKTFDTYFFQVGDHFIDILHDWVSYLRSELLWAESDPLFPATEMGLSADQCFTPIGLKREHWSNTTPIRRIFKTAFHNAGLPYYHPHSFRHTLTALGLKWCKTPEQLKAWSQNSAHNDVLTTLANYGEVSLERQMALIKEISAQQDSRMDDIESLARDFAAQLTKRFQSMKAEVTDPVIDLQASEY